MYSAFRSRATSTLGKFSAYQFDEDGAVFTEIDGRKTWIAPWPNQQLHNMVPAFIHFGDVHDGFAQTEFNWVLHKLEDNDRKDLSQFKKLLQEERTELTKIKRSKSVSNQCLSLSNL